MRAGDGMTADLPPATVARRRAGATRLQENELYIVLLVGDLVVAAGAAIVAPLVWDFIDPKFSPNTDLRLVELAIVIVWIALLRILGGGDLASPRFGRRMLAAVGRAFAAAALLIL